MVLLAKRYHILGSPFSMGKQEADVLGELGSGLRMRIRGKLGFLTTTQLGRDRDYTGWDRVYTGS